MKYALCLIVMLFSLPTLAEDVNCRNTASCVKQECCVPSCDSHTTVCKDRVITKIKKVTVERVVTQTVEKKVFNKNRISILGGVGPTGLNQPTATEVDLVRGAVGGLMYQRSLTESWSLGIQLQTNQTALIGGGYSW